MIHVIWCCFCLVHEIWWFSIVWLASQTSRLELNCEPSWADLLARCYNEPSRARMQTSRAITSRAVTSRAGSISSPTCSGWCQLTLITLCKPNSKSLFHAIYLLTWHHRRAKKLTSVLNRLAPPLFLSQQICFLRQDFLLANVILGIRQNLKTSELQVRHQNQLWIKYQLFAARSRFYLLSTQH
jgi:hypothetical protein